MMDAEKNNILLNRVTIKITYYKENIEMSHYNNGATMPCER